LVSRPDRPQDVHPVASSEAAAPEGIQHGDVVGGDAGGRGRERPAEGEARVHLRIPYGGPQAPAQGRPDASGDAGRCGHSTRRATISGHDGIVSANTSEPAAPRRAPISRSTKSRSNASATASGSGSATRPVTPSETNSSGPPESDTVTTGRRAANASRVT